VTGAENMFIKNCEEVIQIPMDHNGIPSLHVSPTRHIASPNEVEETLQRYKQITKFSSKQ